MKVKNDTQYPPQLEKLGNEFMQAFFAFQPSAGTRAGFHQYDSQMEDLSAAHIQRQIGIYREWERRFLALKPAGWPHFAVADREMMLAFIRSRIFELETTRPWQNDPDHYSAVASDSTFLLMGRNFASPEDRLRALIAREQRMPAMFAEARKNLKNPPRIYTEIAIEQLPGIIDFFRKDVPSAFADVKDPQLNAEFQKSNGAVIAALQDYRAWLKQDLQPRSNGDFRIGATNLNKKLKYEEMVDEPLDKLLARGLENLHRNQREFQRVSKLIDPSKTPQQILDDAQKDHPTADQLIPVFRQKLAGLRQFCDEKHIITTPSPNLPIVKETPAFMRALTSASMDTPGPFETRATEAYFNVTLPEKTATPAEVEEFMRGFSTGVITSTAIHEALPGHFEQYLWNERVSSSIRKFLSLDLSNTGSHFSGTNVEGWAHYTEQMMIDEGYGRTPGVPEDKDVAFLKLRLGQLQDALLRNARYIVAIQMHTGRMSFDEAVQYFQKEGYQTRPTALMEARRGTSDPTYLMYTLGKLQILELRAEMQRKQGAKFSLQDFHDRFMEQGVAPVSIILKAMLAN